MQNVDRGSSLRRLVVNGQFFSTADGQPFTAIECSDFQLLQRFLNGEDIKPVLDERQKIGFNMLRVFGTCANMFRLFPQDFGDRYWTALPAFCQQAGTFGCYVEFTVFADATIVVPDVDDQLDIWKRLSAVAPPIPNLLVEAVNEADQAVNRLDSLQRLAKIPEVLCSHGSNGGGQVPVRPAWDYETFHTNLQPEWWRKVGQNAMELAAGAEGVEGSGVPILANENERHPDNTSSAIHAQDAAAGAALLCAGSCFHSASGKISKRFDPVERRCADAWVKGARSVALEFQRGRYVRRDDLKTSADLRVYQRVLGDGRAETVRIRN